jgi:hypothetical protein
MLAASRATVIVKEGAMRGSRHVRAFTLVEVLVVAVVLIALFAFLAPRYMSRKPDATGRVNTPLGQADSSVCRSNLRSDRQAIEAAKAVDTEGALPATLAEVPGVITELRRCPVGSEPYVYDPSAGTVYCPHPGHERY